ncbi:MAG: HU family DNA-binding protein [Leadbetterella sp.]
MFLTFINYNTVTKAEVISIISTKTGVDKAVASSTVEAFFQTVKEQLAGGEAIYVRGFGSFVNKRRAEKKARNISKKTTVTVPEHFIPSFKPSKEFIEEVKTKVKVK